jgi:Fic family protein
MTKKGVKKLPILIDTVTALTILEKLPILTEKIGRIQSEFQHTIVNNAIVQVLSLSESVESTRIEGTQVTFTDMVEERDNKNPRWEIQEVNNYQSALHYGTEMIINGYPISTRLIKDLHAILMTGARGSTQSAGEYRKIQNFIGPTKRIEDASYIPISAEQINEYMENLEYFINGNPYEKTTKASLEGYLFDETANPLIKTAILHAQFESIHPFLDGNGRLGRILIVLHLIQSGMISSPILFISEELEKEKYRYYDMLNGVRGNEPNWGDWIHFFMDSCSRMADKLLDKLSDAQKLAIDGLSRCSTDSEEKVWIHTFSDPFTTAPRVAEKTGLSPNTARKALSALATKKMLFADDSKRNKKYRNYDLMRILRE